MRAIRRVIPDAQLVQTEDLGKTFSTAPLRYQAAHENERRWLSIDLLCGRVSEGHPLRKMLLGAGIGSEQLDTLLDGAATPDILGINHYLTSERFLDRRTHLYPGHEVGGNGRDTYVDAEAVRVKRLESDLGIGPRLREAWERYNIPIAITEVHHGCHRDEQLRWFAEVWQTAQQLRDEGMDLRAMTIWSMFGNVDWRFLLTQKHGFYDAGAFDVRGKGAAADDRRQGGEGLCARRGIRSSGAGFARMVAPAAAALQVERALRDVRMGRAQAAHHRRYGDAWQCLRADLPGSGLALCLTSREDLDICDEPRSPRRSRSTGPGRSSTRQGSFGSRCGAGEGCLSPGERGRA
jgi:hypothetical protein